MLLLSLASKPLYLKSPPLPLSLSTCYSSFLLSGFPESKRGNVVAEIEV